MEHPALLKMAALAQTPDALEATVCYLAEKLFFLKRKEKVLILFSGKESGSIGALMGQAVLRREAEPIFWEDDLRWKTLLRLAFSSRATTIIGPPLIVLGLSKLARAQRTPLNIRNVVTAGYPCLDWMIDGIIKGLDCKTWGCFEPGGGAVVAGFSCGKSRGVHLREDVYTVEIVDETGAALPEGRIGDIVLVSNADPSVRYPHTDRARLDTSPCMCGCKSPRLMDIHHGENIDSDLTELGAYLQSWSSILDCAVAKGPYGLELDMVVFPGEKLPKLPTCARRVIRAWNPEQDKPFLYFPNLITPLF